MNTENIPNDSWNKTVRVHRAFMWSCGFLANNLVAGVQRGNFISMVKKGHYASLPVSIPSPRGVAKEGGRWDGCHSLHWEMHSEHLKSQFSLVHLRKKRNPRLTLGKFLLRSGSCRSVKSIYGDSLGGKFSSRLERIAWGWMRRHILR